MTCMLALIFFFGSIILTDCRLEGLVPNTPRHTGVNGVNGSTVKRKSEFQTPASKAGKAHPMSSPGGMKTPGMESSTTSYVSMAHYSLASF